MEWFLRIWLPIAIAITGVCGVSFWTVQQIYRQSLNDPQVQIAEDAAFAMENGAKPENLFASSTRIDIGASLRPYVVIYDKDLKPIVWTGELDGEVPMPPKGVFENAKGPHGSGLGENRVTWQPNDEVRSAIVVVHVLKTDGYVLSGRNMRETEDRIWQIQALVGAAWILTLAATLVATWLGARVAVGKTGVIW
jgi:hypothetical protein